MTVDAGTAPPVSRRRFLVRGAGAVRHGRWLHAARRAMACRFEMTLPAEDPRGTEDALAALDLVDRLEAQLSVYRADSAVSDLNRRAAMAPVRVDPHLFALLRRAARLSALTDGAFDPTAGPLVRCWGFFERAGAVPEPAGLADALARTGIRQLHFGRDRTVTFARQGVELNLGGIGKGYALDRAGRLLRRRGRRCALLNGGSSSVLAIGHPPDQDRWIIGLRDPARRERRWALLRLADAAVATSGVAEQSFVADGRRYGHLLDPRSGQPVDGRLSVTVVASCAAEADALATAFFVGGPSLATRCARDRTDLLAIFHDAGASIPMAIGQHSRCRLEVQRHAS
jgi:thiamine biosynthesis lipoprotein